MSVTPLNPKGFSVLIIGTGFAGVCMAIKLKQAGMHNFQILEKAPRVGGTWRDNTYPGAACDVPSHLYSYSFEPKHDWSRQYAEQPEILGYIEHCVDKYGIRPHIRFDTEVAHAEFDEDQGCWAVHTQEGDKVTANVLVSGCGQLNQPAYPKIKGMNTFQGESFHSARWNHDYDLRGKRVAVIGTGASAIQFVPPVVAQAEHVTVFQRSPAWVMAKGDHAIPEWEQRLFKLIPFSQELYRLYIYLNLESRFLAFAREGVISKLMSRVLSRGMREKIDSDALFKRLMPDFPPGCKRILLTNDYLDAVQQPNAAVVCDSIREITAEGVVDADGTLHAVDAIIYGTGFKTTEFLSPMQITGLNGIDLNHAWREGAEAYRGVALSGFPNFYMLYGPNTNLGHNSIIFMIECQVRFAMDCMRKLRSHRMKYLDVKPDAQRDYNDQLQDKASRTVWNAGCSSWYKNEHGRITNNWPGSTLLFRWHTRKANLKDFTAAYR